MASSKLKRLAAVSAAGGTSGAILGGLTGLAEGPKAALRKAAIGGLIGGTAAPVTQAAGEAVMGPPKQGDTNPYTHRGALGGAALGGLAGAAGMAALGGKIPLGKLGALGAKAEGALSSDHAILNRLRALANDPNKIKQALGIGAGAGVGGLAGMHFGSDEGEGLDIINNEIEAHRDRKRKKKMMEES